MVPISDFPSLWFKHTCGYMYGEYSMHNVHILVSHTQSTCPLGKRVTAYSYLNVPIVNTKLMPIVEYCIYFKFMFISVWRVKFGS